MKAQTIQIDSTFFSDGEIFPFSPNDTIYGLSISGSVALHSDTSLVRVILTDIYGQEWMVFEAYPMIVADTVFDIVEECDETCYLSQSIPISVSIQIIDAQLSVSQLSMGLSPFQNVNELQHQAKIEKDIEKSQNINHYIAVKGWNWIADTNSISNLFYSEKVVLFKEKYHLLGRDFYSGGAYHSIFHDMIPEYLDRTYISSFDWREKHNANIDTSPYYTEGGDPNNGWLTDLSNQGDCSSCSAFGCIATLEAAINLYSNYQFDYIEGVRFSERDAFNCSNYVGGHQGCDCDEGKPIYKILNKIINDGVVNDSCYPWEAPYCEFTSGTCEENAIHKCPEPDWIAQICGRKTFNLNDSEYQSDRINYLKSLLITNGPLTIELHHWPDDTSKNHAVSLIGFKPNESTGVLEWIFKNSWGGLWGNKGYGYEPLWLGSGAGPGTPSIVNIVHSVKWDYEDCPVPITVISNLDPYFELTVHKNDFDQDGYYNWGIGHNPSTYHCGLAADKEDSNDDNNRIGPYDENFIEQDIQPEMQVALGTWNPVQVNNNDVIYITGNSAIDNYYTFSINNTGYAQLNFQKVSLPAPDHAFIEISSQNHSGQFDYEFEGNDYLDTAVCMNSLETFQIKLKSGANPGDLAHFHIHVDETDIDDFEFTLIYNACQTNTGYDSITTITNWDEMYNSQVRDLLIKSGGKLTITGTVFLSSEADIFISRDGKLVIDGGKLTGTCGNMWNGIEVWGNNSMPQTSVYQGTVEIINGGTIEFADTAIATLRINGIYTIPTGGIIKCEDAIFKDNYVGIYMAPYLEPHGHANISRFIRTQFNITDEYYNLENLIRTAPKCGFQLGGVSGIYIEGCGFTNSSTARKRSRGIGILNMDAGCYIKNACEQGNNPPCEETVQSRFEGLDYGIKAANIYSSRTLSVESSEFIDNYRGIYMSLINDVSVIKNSFELNTDEEYFEPGDTLLGIYTERCNRYQIEENVINGVDPDHFNLVGMHILNSGPRGNEIYNNTLNNLFSGITAAGENRDEVGTGLCIKCNDFTSCYYDIYVTSKGGSASNYFGIASAQGEENHLGDPTYAAGNTFSKESGSNPNYTNEDKCNPIIYTHHGIYPSDKQIIPNPIEPPLPSRQITLFSDGGVDYTDKSTACPSHLIEGIYISNEKNNLIEETESIIADEDSLTFLIDGGETDLLNFDIQTSFPDEALLLRQELLDNSPFLSDTVMKSAIYKDDVLPNAIIRDILTANPQSAKSDGILEAVVNRIDPLPDYMLTEILQGQNVYGAKEIMEQNLAEHKLQRDKSLSKLIKYYKADTNNIESDLDSLIGVMQYDNNLSTDYELVLLYFGLNDSTNAFGVISNIPSKFNLSESELAIHNQYSSLLNLLYEISNDTTAIDSLQTETLFNLSEINNSIPGIYSRNVLTYKNLSDHEETVYLPEFTLKSLPESKINQPSTYNSSQLKVFPNPSGIYFIVDYNIENLSNPALIELLSMDGKILKSWQLEDKQNQIIVSTEEYGSGMYYIKLLSENNVKETVKLFIKK
jgi:hypothetical protein